MPGVTIHLVLHGHHQGVFRHPAMDLDLVQIGEAGRDGRPMAGQAVDDAATDGHGNPLCEGGRGTPAPSGARPASGRHDPAQIGMGIIAGQAQVEALLQDTEDHGGDEGRRVGA